MASLADKSEAEVLEFFLRAVRAYQQRQRRFGR